MKEQNKNEKEESGLDRAIAISSAITKGNATKVKQLWDQFGKELEEQERQEKERIALKSELDQLLVATCGPIDGKIKEKPDGTIGGTINEMVRRSRRNFHQEGKSNHFINKEDHVKGEISQVVTKWFFALTKEQQNLLASDPNQDQSYIAIIGDFRSGERFSYTYQLHFHKEQPQITIENMIRRRLFSL